MKFSRWVLALGMLAVASPVLATGFGGDAPPSRIPIPARDFKAKVEDHGGTTIEVDRVSWNGEVFLYGKLGAAQLTLPFENIKTVVFEPSKEAEKRTATATTTDGDTVELQVEEDTPCYGKTKHGNYAITAEDIRRIEFLH